ncbi:MAG: laccase domain-containing protein [Verrucomicrobiae bacterium]|nr:laccase domain-containing protein [Verrucomicrobiae bacterium]
MIVSFAFLSRFPWVAHGFIPRWTPGGASPARAEEKLTPHHVAMLRARGISHGALALAEQIHGRDVALVARGGEPPRAGADGLATETPGVALGIHVADCGAIYLVDPVRRAIALLHSGKRGTAAGIPEEGVSTMARAFGSRPGDLVAALSPCIHACCYEVDFAAEILRRLAAAGVREVWRHPDCTACRPDRYDSYRRDKGRTGRMLAFLMIREMPLR